MEFYGLIKSTLLDYPNRVASVIFTKGCNLACPYCHNKELVTGECDLPAISFDSIMEHLTKRKNVLSGVVISGGEPLLYSDELQNVIDDIHSLGLAVKLDTNGILYDKLTTIKNVDFYAMDIKTATDKYTFVCRHFSEQIAENVMASIRYIMTSGKEYEFRTTVVPTIVTLDDIEYICSNMIAGAKKYSLAQFRPTNTLDPEYEKVSAYGYDFFEKARQIVQSHGIECELRVGY